MLEERGSRELVHWLRYTTMVACGAPKATELAALVVMAVLTEVVISALTAAAERTGRSAVGSGDRHWVAVLGRTPVAFETPSLDWCHTLSDQCSPYQE